MRAGALSGGDVENAHCLSLQSGGAEELFGRAARCEIGEWLGGEFTGLRAVLQLVDRPGREPDAEGTLTVLAGVAIAGPIIGGGGTGEALACLAVGDPAPAQGFLVEADDADEIRR